MVGKGEGNKKDEPRMNTEMNSQWPDEPRVVGKRKEEKGTDLPWTLKWTVGDLMSREWLGRERNQGRGALRQENNWTAHEHWNEQSVAWSAASGLGREKDGLTGRERNWLTERLEEGRGWWRVGRTIGERVLMSCTWTRRKGPDEPHMNAEMNRRWPDEPRVVRKRKE